MLLAKLKPTVGAVMVMLTLGASGLVYRASGQPAPNTTEQTRSGKPRSELEALRRENELLKLNLEVVLEKVRAQEAELRQLKAQVGKVSGVAVSPDAQRVLITPSNDVRIRLWDPQTGKQIEKIVGSSKQGIIHLWDVESGKKMNQKAVPQSSKADNKQELQRTVEALERALKELREQLKKQEAPPASK